VESTPDSRTNATLPVLATFKKEKIARKSPRLIKQEQFSITNIFLKSSKTPPILVLCNTTTYF